MKLTIKFTTFALLSCALSAVPALRAGFNELADSETLLPEERAAELFGIIKAAEELFFNQKSETARKEAARYATSNKKLAIIEQWAHMRTVEKYSSLKRAGVDTEACLPMMRSEISQRVSLLTKPHLPLLQSKL